MAISQQIYKIIPMARYIAFSDIQGNQSALKHFLDEIITIQRDRTIYLGDRVYDGIGAEEYVLLALGAIPDLVSVKSKLASNTPKAIVLPDLLAMYTSIRQKEKPLRRIEDIVKEFQFMQMFPQQNIFLFGATKQRVVYGFGQDGDIEKITEDNVQLKPLSAYFINPGSIGNYNGEQTFAIIDTGKKEVVFKHL